MILYTVLTVHMNGFEHVKHETQKLEAIQAT